MMGFETQEQLLIRKLREEVASLRAELAAAIARMKLYENDDKHASVTRALGRSNAWRERAEAAEAERDALRALLREAREAWAELVDYPDYVVSNRARAMLNKGGGDE